MVVLAGAGVLHDSQRLRLREREGSSERERICVRQCVRASESVLGAIASAAAVL